MFFQTLDILDHLFLASHMVRQLICSHKAYFNTFYIQKSCSVITEGRDAGILHNLYGVGITLLSIVTAVIICQIGRFHRTFCKDLHIFRIPFKSKLLNLPLEFLCGENTFHVHDCQIILRKYRKHLLEKISRILHCLIFCRKTGGIVKVLICSQSTVSCSADGKTDLLRLFFLDFLGLLFLFLFFLLPLRPCSHCPYCQHQYQKKKHSSCSPSQDHFLPADLTAPHFHFSLSFPLSFLSVLLHSLSPVLAYARFRIPEADSDKYHVCSRLCLLPPAS